VNVANKMKLKPGPANLLLAASMSLLLGGCAALSPTGGADTRAGAAASGPATPASTAQAAAPLMPEENTSSTPVEAGINREGRVIQLGRFSETTPSFTTPANDSVELNYEQEDLRLVFEQLGTALGISMLIDPTIDTKVSLRTSPSSPLTYADIWPLMRLLARNAGVTIEQNGAVYEFKRSASNVPAEIVLPAWLGEATASTVLQVTPLTYISLEAAEAVIKPLLQPDGTIIRLGSANLLGISGSPQQLERVNALLAILDDDPFQNRGIQLYELLNSRASDVADELGSVLNLVEGEQPSYQVLGLDRINAVLVVAPAERGFDEVTRWIRILDAESQEQVEQLFVYRVKNLKALTLAQTLTSVFEQVEDDSAIVEPNPLTGTLFQAGQGGVLAALADTAVPQESSAEGTVSANITVTIVADEETNSLLIRATPREFRQLLTTINGMDRVTSQVLIHAVIGQVTLTDGTRFGIDWTRVSGNLASGPARLSANFLPSSPVDDAGQAITGSGLVLTRTFMDGSAMIDATLNAIAEDNEVTLLARPTILATNNKEGSIHVGQSVPVNNGTTIGVGGTSTTNISYQNVGIDLKITPQINDDGFISLAIEQALSSVEEGATGVAGNPTFTDQKIVTSVVVADQAAITLGGLIQEEETDQQAGVPGLQKVPVLGRLFSYTDNRRVRRELFVILRPQIIHGDQRDEIVLQEFSDTFTNVGTLLKESGL
jgi:general secretion pathway protein D